jgi:hypothetical protein
MDEDIILKKRKAAAIRAAKYRANNVKKKADPDFERKSKYG